MLYRIYTKRANLPEIERIVSDQFPGFTLIQAEGFWRLQREESLIIEICCPKSKREQVNELAAEIRDANKQESVLVQELQNDNWLI